MKVYQLLRISSDLVELRTATGEKIETLTHIQAIRKYGACEVLEQNVNPFNHSIAVLKIIQKEG